jgi:uncharacterized protein
MNPSSDHRIVEVQIGRPLRADTTVVSRCHLGLPVVVQVPPVLDDGTPFPTLYWLSCPLARGRVGRLESAGGVKRMEQKAESAPEFADRLRDAHDSYRRARDELLDSGMWPAPTGGVGGARTGVKCLHAHYAHTRAGGDNPVGELVRDWIEPLDCSVPCVLDGVPNPEWSHRR